MCSGAMDIFNHRPQTSPGIILSHVVICIALGYLCNLTLHMLYKNILWKLLHCREQVTSKSSVFRVGSFLLPGFDNVYVLVCFKSSHWNSVLSPASARYYRLWQTLHISSQSRSLSRIAASATHMNSQLLWVNSLHILKNANCQFVSSPSTRHRIFSF